MNAAEKARLAKEKRENEEKAQREKEAAKRKKQRDQMFERLQRDTGICLMIVAAIALLVSFVFAIRLLTSYTEGLSTMEVLFGGFRGGNMNVEIAKTCWAIIAVDVVILGLMLLHWRWSEKMLVFGGEVGWGLFIVFAIAVGIFLLEVGFCWLLYMAA